MLMRMQSYYYYSSYLLKTTTTASSRLDGSWERHLVSGAGSIEVSELTFNKVIVGILNGLGTVVLHPRDAEKIMHSLFRKLSVGTPVYTSAL